MLNKIKKILGVLFIALSIMSCTKDDDGYNIVEDTDILIKYVNEKGKNILDYPFGIESSKIKIYHKINNEWIGCLNGDNDCQKDCFVANLEGIKYLNLTPSTDFIKGNYSETKIELSNGESDIIKAEFDLSKNNIICTKVWYNEILMWEASSIKRVIEVKK